MGSGRLYEQECTGNCIALVQGYGDAESEIIDKALV